MSITRTHLAIEYGMDGLVTHRVSSTPGTVMATVTGMTAIISWKSDGKALSSRWEARLSVDL